VMSGIDDKPIALMNTALVRSKMCELVAIEMGVTPASYSTVGLLSILDALMDKPMEEVLASLPLSEEINIALLHRGNLVGEVLDAVISYDEGSFDKVEKLNRPDVDFKKCYLEAIRWATDITCGFER